MFQNYKHFRCKEDIVKVITIHCLLPIFFKCFSLTCNDIQVLSYKWKTILQKTNQGSFSVFSSLHVSNVLFYKFFWPLKNPSPGPHSSALLHLAPTFQIWHPLPITLSSSNEQSCSSPGLSKQSQGRIPRVQFAVTSLWFVNFQTLLLI